MLDRFFKWLEKISGLSREQIIRLSGPIIIVLVSSAVYGALRIMHIPHRWALATAIALVFGTIWWAASPKLLEWFKKKLGLSQSQTLMWSWIAILILFGIAIFVSLIARGNPLWLAVILAIAVSGAFFWSRKKISVRRVRWGGCLVLILLVFSLALWSELLLPQPTPHGKIGVWIAEFSGDTTGEQVRLINEIRQFVIENVDLKDLVEVRNLQRPILGETNKEEFENAQRLGNQVNADLVLFGDVTKRFVYPKIAIIQYPQLLFSRAQLLYRVSSFELDRISDIPAIDVKKTTLVVKILAGFIYYLEADYLRAQTLLESVLEEFKQIEEAIAPESLRGVIGNCNLQLSLKSDNPRSFLIRAFSLFQEALTAEDPWLLAAIHSNLGVSYRQLAEYEEPSKNLKLAIASYQEALRLWPADADRLDYAIFQNNLGVAREKLAEYEQPVANLKQASDAYQEALSYLTADVTILRKITNWIVRPLLGARIKHAQPLWYAQTQNNWGVAHEKLANYEKPIINLKQAIDAYRKALHSLPSDADPDRAYYATFQNNLGVAYSKLTEYEEFVANIRQAIGAYQEALRYQSCKATPLGYALTQYNLALTYISLAEKEDIGTNLSRAISSLACALVIWDETGSLKARSAAAHLIAAREGLGIDQFQLILESQLKKSPCGIDPSEVLNLMQKWTE